jgi:hypothetical protein
MTSPEIDTQVLPAKFVLQKWYLDCVTADGDAAIVYCADLSWRQIHLHYSSVLASRGCSVTSRTSMATFTAPAIEKDVVPLTLPKLGISGTWERSAAPVQHTMFECSAGRVHWNCAQPRSAARLDVVDLGGFVGLGYAECLTLTLPPWKLPMRQLRWGRFLSPDDCLVWIDWQGPFNSRFAVYNGQQCAPTAISDSEIVLDAGALQLDRDLSLRAGQLGDTVLPGAPILRKLLPSSLFGIEERKWRSHGTLTLPGSSSSGWAIHEVVHWNT